MAATGRSTVRLPRSGEPARPEAEPKPRVTQRPTEPPTEWPTLRPDHWSGEVDCRVGPFHTIDDAERFSNDLVDFGRYETIRERVVIDDPGVYVEMSRWEG